MPLVKDIFSTSDVRNYIYIEFIKMYPGLYTKLSAIRQRRRFRLLQIRVCACICTILFLMAAIQYIIAPSIFSYSYLPARLIECELYKHTVSKLTLQKTKPDCKYDEILKSKESANPKDIPTKFEHFDAKGLENGSYVPSHCNPLLSVAILVTYRNRQKQLDVFLPYMHDFLRKQNIHYKIYLIEQQDQRPFNRGMLLNIGAKQAIEDQFPCLILHDVDLLPLDASNLYACTNYPRHMSASIDKLRYEKLVGGVLAIRADKYLTVNGFSNRFGGWSGEDDDFAYRLSMHRMHIIRFPRKMTRYTMMPHCQRTQNSRQGKILYDYAEDVDFDGLSTMSYHSSQLTEHPLFTLIGVRI